MPEVTNEQLAEMIKSGFDGVDVRFDILERRLDRIEARILADHDARIKRIEDALALKA